MITSDIYIHGEEETSQIFSNMKSPPSAHQQVGSLIKGSFGFGTRPLICVEIMMLKATNYFFLVVNNMSCLCHLVCGGWVVHGLNGMYVFEFFILIVLYPDHIYN